MIAQTDCAGCQFRKMEAGKQVDCLAHDLKWWSPKLHSDGDRFIIDNKICQYYRGADWKGGENATQKVREEVRIKWVPIVNHKLVNPLDAVPRLLQQTLKPYKVLVCVNEVIPALQNYPEVIQFRTVDMDPLDWAAAYHPAQFHVYFREWTLPKDHFERLDRAINDEAKTFVVLKSPKYTIYSGQLWRFGIRSVKTFLENAQMRGVVELVSG